MPEDCWRQALDELAAVVDATERGVQVPWVPPAHLPALPPELRGRAEQLARDLERVTADLHARRVEVGRLRRLLAVSVADSPGALDIAG